MAIVNGQILWFQSTVEEKDSLTCLRLPALRTAGRCGAHRQKAGQQRRKRML